MEIKEVSGETLTVKNLLYALKDIKPSAEIFVRSFEGGPLVEVTDILVSLPKTNEEKICIIFETPA